jgi:hypothetical protein
MPVPRPATELGLARGRQPGRTRDVRLAHDGAWLLVLAAPASTRSGSGNTPRTRSPQVMRPDPRAGLTLKFQDTCSGGEHRARQTAPRWRPGGHGWPSLSVAIHRRNSRDDLSAPPCAVSKARISSTIACCSRRTRGNGARGTRSVRTPDGCRAFRNSGGGTRTHNPSVNSRMLCH